MCIFTYQECRGCPFKACRLYSSHVDYCEAHLDAYKLHSQRPEFPCLIVEEEDEHGGLDDWDGKISYRTKPEDRSEQFSKLGCNRHEFRQVGTKRDGPKCPYHKRGGLKERWDRLKKKGDIGAKMLQDKRDVKREEREKEEKKKNDGWWEKERKGEPESDGCCVVQ